MSPSIRQHMRDCSQKVETNMMCHCACIFPSTLISGIITSLQPQLRLLPYSPMLIQGQILEISCYICGTLQVASSFCNVFMTAILLMILFIMFCSSHCNDIAIFPLFFFILLRSTAPATLRSITDPRSTDFPVFHQSPSRIALLGSAVLTDVTS